MTPYQKNRIIVYGAQIKKLEEKTPLLKKQPLKILGFGIITSITAPNYTGHYDYMNDSQGGNSVLERSKLDYLELVLYFFIGYVFFVLLGHFIFTLQDKLKLKKLKAQLKQVEDDVANGKVR